MSDIPENRESAPRRWWQFSLRSLLLLVLACSLLCGLLVWWLRPVLLYPSYFPLGVGYRWVYASINAGQTRDDVVFEVVGTEKIGDADCFVIVRTIGDHQIKFYVQVTRRGVLIHQVGEDRYVPAYRQFAFYTKPGDHWNWKGKIGDEQGEYECSNSGVQQVIVPLGQWDAFWVHQRSPDGVDTYFRLVNEIGVVWISSKQRDKHDPPPPAGESSQFDWQLKEFFRP